MCFCGAPTAAANVGTEVVKFLLTLYRHYEGNLVPDLAVKKMVEQLMLKCTLANLER